jgi:hypothetical protein
LFIGGLVIAFLFIIFTPKFVQAAMSSTGITQEQLTMPSLRTNTSTNADSYAAPVLLSLWFALPDSAGVARPETSFQGPMSSTAGMIISQGRQRLTARNRVSAAINPVNAPLVFLC